MITDEGRLHEKGVRSILLINSILKSWIQMSKIIYLLVYLRFESKILFYIF